MSSATNVDGGSDYVGLEVARLVTTPAIPLGTLRHWIAIGRLPHFKPGRRVLVRRSDLLALIEASRR